MSYTAYFIGGPADLTKKVMPGNVAHRIEMHQRMELATTLRCPTEVSPRAMEVYEAVWQDGDTVVYRYVP